MRWGRGGEFVKMLWTQSTPLKVGCAARAVRARLAGHRPVMRIIEVTGRLVHTRQRVRCKKIRLVIIC